MLFDNPLGLESIIRDFNARQPPDARSIMEIEAARGVPYAERRSGVLTRLRLYRDGDGGNDATHL